MLKGIRDVAGSIARAVTRTTAFLRKDIVDFVRQPRLVLALVLGPFLILLLFGLGFRSAPISLRTIIVIGEDNQLRSYVEENADNLVRQLVLVDIVETESYARHQLINNKVDVVIVVPDNVEQKIRSNEQAVFVTFHNTIDPMQTNYVRAFTNVYVSEVNRRAHLIAVREAQRKTEEVEPEIEAAREDAAGLRQAMERGDEEGAWEELLQLRRALAMVQTALGPSEWLLIGSGELLSGPEGGEQENGPKDLFADSLEDLNALSQTEGDQLDSQASLERAAQLEEDLAQLETAMEEFRSADPDVIVSPFAGDNRTVGRIEIDMCQVS